MTSKLLQEKKTQKHSQMMFQFVFLIKKFKESDKRYILKTFLNTMIGNIKIHNIFNIFEISKFVEPNKCIHFFKMKIFI